MRLPILILLALDPSAATVAAAVSAPAAPAIAAIVGPAGGRVGFAALDLQSGKAIGWQADERFPTQSVFKLPIAIEVLLRADAGSLDLKRNVALSVADARPGPPGTMAVPTTRTIGELLEAMITHSGSSPDKSGSRAGCRRARRSRTRPVRARPEVASPMPPSSPCPTATGSRSPSSRTRLPRPRRSANRRSRGWRG
jgi:hypothetical protein